MQLIFLMLLLSPVLVFFIHGLLIRLAKRKPYQLTAILSILFGNIPIVFLCLFTEGRNIILYSLMVYNALGYVYFHIFNMSETARRIRLLIDLKKEGRLKREDILRRYGPGDIIDIRLRRLLNLRQLKLENNLYKNSGFFLLMAARIYGIWVRMLGYKIQCDRF